MIDYNIIATGSKGNAVVIDQKILIDCGVSFKALSKVYRALKLVLLTHIHSDHFQPTTLLLLAENRTKLRFACCAWLCKPAPNYDLYMVEANYDDAEIQAKIAEKKLNGEYIYELGVLHNHMSLAKINDWLYANMGQNSAYIYMHCHQDKEDAT